MFQIAVGFSLAINLENKDTILELLEKDYMVGVRSIIDSFFQENVHEDLSAILEGIVPDNSSIYDVLIPENDDDITENIYNVYGIDSDLDAIFYRTIADFSFSDKPMFAIDFQKRLNDTIQEFESIGYNPEILPIDNLDNDSDDDIE